MTFYYLGPTFCGGVHSNSDKIAAIDVSYFSTRNRSGNFICGKKVLITELWSGESVQAVVLDKCISCRETDIDVSPAVFKIFKPLSVGRILVKWNFIE